MPAKKKLMSAKKASELAAELISVKEKGKACYERAGELIDQLIAGGLVGVGIPVDGDAVLRLVDQFDGGKTNKVFKSTVFERYKLVVSET